MGEAKQRRANDPLYGRVPKPGRGIVLSDNFVADHISISDLTGPSPTELRHALLFWDRLVWPRSPILGVGMTPDEKFLVDAGVIKRPIVAIPTGPIPLQSHGHLLAQAFIERDAAEPGLWTMSGGIEDVLRKRVSSDKLADRGLLVELYRCIPVPAAEVPLHDILEFREKRRAELVLLQLEIEGMYQEILKAGDPATAFETKKLLIEKEVVAALRVAKESGLRFHLADWKLNINIDVSTIAQMAVWAKAGADVGATVGLPMVGSVIGGAVPLLSLSKSWGAKSSSNSAFRYVTSVHSELLGPG